MTNIFLSLELIAMVLLILRFLNISGLILFFLFSFYFLVTYSFSIPLHENSYNALLDLKSLFIVSIICSLSINKIKEAPIKFDVFALNIFSFLLVFSIAYDFFTMPIDRFLVGSAYKFGFLMNTILINRLVNPVSYNLGFILLSIVPFNKWMVFYYLHLLFQRLKPKLSNIGFYIVIFLFATFAIQIVYGSVIEYFLGRVVASDISGNVFIRDGSRQIIWNFLLINSELFHIIPKYGAWYLNYYGVAIHDHNIFIFLVSRLSYFVGGIILLLSVLKLHRLFSTLKFRLLYLNYFLIFFVSTLWANLLFIYSLVILIAVSTNHNEDEVRKMAPKTN